MNNVGEKYLPLGSVVMLKGASKRLMVTGFCTMAAEDASGVMYDYSGCMYPEGVISSDQTALFNHDQIEKIYHMGLVDEEEKSFKMKLVQLVNSQNVISESAPQVIREQESVVPVVETPVAQPVVAPVTQVESVETPVPPIGPGLPGYVAPVVETPVVPVTPVVPIASVEAPMAPTTSGGFQFDANGNVIAAPVAQPEQPAVQPFANIQFDENGTVVSA